MTTLIVTPYTPALGSGRALRLYTVVRALAALEPVVILYVRFGAADPGPEYTTLHAVDLRPVSASRGLRRALTFGLAVARGVPVPLARGVSPELAAEAERAAREPGIGRVVADGPIAAVALHRLARRRPVVYCAHNLESAFRHELDESGIGGRRRVARLERRILLAAAESWMVSAADIDGARALAPGSRLRYVPNAVDVASIAPVAASPETPPRALLLADYTYEPNRTAARLLVDEVMPHVWRALPDAELLLAGRGLPSSFATDPRVSVLGFVEDLRDTYAAARCVVVPLLQGGGSPLKLVEALAYGVPVVATPKAAAGLDLVPGEHFAQAGPAARPFADAVVRVLRDGAPAIAQAGRRIAEERYSVDALRRALTVPMDEAGIGSVD